jgi:hypothetical protein
MTTSNQAKDFLDYWHLQYAGTMSLPDFMELHAGWTDMDYTYWELTGEIPSEEKD